MNESRNTKTNPVLPQEPLCISIAQFTKEQFPTFFFDKHPPFKIGMLYLYTFITCCAMEALAWLKPDFVAFHVAALVCAVILYTAPWILYWKEKKKTKFPFSRETRFTGKALTTKDEKGHIRSVLYQKLTGFAEDGDNVVLFHRRGRTLLSKSNFERGSWEEAKRLILVKKPKLKSRKPERRQYLWVLPVMILFLLTGGRMLMRAWNPSIDILYPQTAEQRLWTRITQEYDDTYHVGRQESAQSRHTVHENLVLVGMQDLNRMADPVLYVAWAENGKWNYAELNKYPHSALDQGEITVTTYLARDTRFTTIFIPSAGSGSAEYSVVAREQEVFHPFATTDAMPGEFVVVVQSEADRELTILKDGEPILFRFE